MMRKFLILFFHLLVFSPLSAQPTAVKMEAGHTQEGIVYFLPKTVLHFHLLVEKKTFTPGEFSRYAEKYLRLLDVCQEEEVAHNVINIDITSSGIRDTSKCYALKLKGGKSEMAEVRLGDDGVLLAINATPMVQQVRSPFKPSPRIGTPSPHRYLSAEVLSAGSVAKMAELTARQMQELQEKRQQLITGEADDLPQDERQLRLMVEKIDREYDALLSLFTGTVRRDTVERTLTLCPEQEIHHEVLFRLSKQLGLVDKDDLAGVPYYINIEDPYKTNLEKYPVPENKKMEGFYVNVPGRVLLTLQREDHQLATFPLSVAQFGFVELRDASVFKRYATHVQINPSTGAVERFYTETDKK